MATRKGGSRHLIYFIDGTWLWAADDKNLDVYSNVWRMNTLLNADDEKGRAQIVHYSRGLGAVDDKVQAYVAGGLAFGIDEMIADLYINICSNYQRGDKIYIFGFSRGAVVARALTGLLSFGILEAHHINLFAHVWAAYTGQSGEVLLPGAARTTIDVPKNKPFDYTAHCSQRHPRIEFVGVFDTVVGGAGLAEKFQEIRLASGPMILPHRSCHCMITRLMSRAAPQLAGRATQNPFRLDYEMTMAEPDSRPRDSGLGFFCAVTRLAECKNRCLPPNAPVQTTA
jgi:hypothetical protein